MAIRVNPFHELYVGESIGPDKFVHLFSDVIVEHALSLFQPGHVILKGLPGTGKSMLLNLLKPSIRLAYSKAHIQFPVPDNLMKFIGAGINLKRSGISDFGQRPIDSMEQNEITSPLYFADFLNYWVVTDMFNSIKLYLESPNQGLLKEIGLEYTDKKIKEFTKEFCKSDCWSGYLSNIKSFNDLKKRLHERITNYRAFLNYNIKELPENISKTKTLIGIPISKAAELLKKYELMHLDTEVYIRIDQYEELAWLGESTPGLGSSYQEMIRKLLGLRDTNVSYRIGTRHFAWNDDSKKMFGSSARLEKKRNYSEISIDSVLRRKENTRTWVFPKFAEDIFSRRITNSNYEFNETHTSLLSEVFGKGYRPAQMALNYLPNRKEKAIILEDAWPENWKSFLQNLAKTDPLSARLGEAWARQKGKEKIVNDIPTPPYPWESKNKVWWRKERIEQALMQIASRNRQQLIWYGKDDILGLSGGNILIFLSICQHIFDVWIRDRRNERSEDWIKLPNLDSVIQSAGIRETSVEWYENISNEKGGKERKEFISYVGSLFYESLVEDKAMSYPGSNGFSIRVEDLGKNNFVHQFFKDASDYGDLYDMPHTSKSKEKKGRKKFYLNPILSPYFRIPYAHTKEPIYIKLNELITWLRSSKVYDHIDALPSEVKMNKEKISQGTLQF